MNDWIMNDFERRAILLWDKGFDTWQIAKDLRCKEDVVYSMLPRLREARRAERANKTL